MKRLKEKMEMVIKVVYKWRVDEYASQSRSTRPSLNYKRMSGRVQDEINFDPEEWDTLPCAVCGDLCVIPIEWEDEIDRKDNALLQAHVEKVRRWNSLPEASHGGNLSKAATSSQLLGCFSQDELDAEVNRWKLYKLSGCCYAG